MIGFRTLPLCLLLALPATAQTADDIIAKNIDARGGLARLQAVQTVRYTARVPFGRRADSTFDETIVSRNIAVMIYETKRPNLSRATMLVPGFSQLEYEQALRNNMSPEQLQSFAAKAGQKQLLEQASRGDYSYPGAYMINGFDGKTAWMWTSQQGKITRPSSGGPTEFGFDGPLVDYRAKGYRAELQGKIKTDGRECFKLRLTSKNGDVATYYIDAATFLEVVVESKQSPVPLTVRRTYRDWKAVEGVMVAHTVVQNSGSAAGNQVMTIDKVEFNVPIDNQRFVAPSETK